MLVTACVLDAIYPLGITFSILQPTERDKFLGFLKEGIW